MAPPAGGGRVSLLRLRIDPGAADGLFAGDGEYVDAVRRLRERPGIADEVFLHAYAYEMLERLRGVMAGESPSSDGAVVVPFWPPALLDAAGETVHSVNEIVALFPAWGEVELVRAGSDAIEREARRVLGAVRFDPRAYADHVEAAAVSGGWRIAGDLHDRATAGAFLFRADGRFLVERRPPAARVDPDVFDTPGGHLEVGEAPAAALARELKEELGIAPIQPRIAAVQFETTSDGTRYRHFVFLVTAWTGELAARQGQTLEWWSPHEARSRDAVQPRLGPAIAALVERGWLG